jgi:spore germination protein KB
MSCLLAVFFFGSATALGGNFDFQDSWVCIVIGFLLALLLFYIYAAVVELYPGRNYYDNIIRACGWGGIPGKILVLILSLYALFTGALLLREQAEFIHIVNLTETPLLAIEAALTGTAVFVMRTRMNVMARLAKFLLPILIAISGITVVLSVKDWHFSHLKPFLSTGFPGIAGGSLLVLSLPFGESAVCASLFGQLERKAKPFRVFRNGALLGAVVILWSNMRNTLILGYSNGLYAFPSYMAVSVVAFGEFFSRVEVMIGIVLLFSGLAKICVFLFCCTSGFAKVLGLKDYEPISAAGGLLILSVAIFVVKDSQELLKLIPFIPYYSLPIQVLVPLAALITGKLRSGGKEKGKRRPKRVSKSEDRESARAE